MDHTTEHTATPKAEEHSGIYEIQALAESAKKRQAERQASESGAESALLASSSTLEAIVLPDPQKSGPMPTQAALSGVAPIASANVSAVIPANLPQNSPHDDILGRPANLGSSKKWPLAGLGVAACATIAFFAYSGLTGSTESANEQTAATTVAINAPAPSSAKPIEGTGTPASLSKTPKPVVTALPIEDNSAHANKGNTAEEPDQGEATVHANSPVKVAQADGDLVQAKEAEKPASKTVRPKNPSQGSQKTKTVAKDTDSEENEIPRSADSDTKNATKQKDSEPEAKKPATDTSMDEVLSSVTGGIDAPTVVQERKQKPSKKRLERGDIAQAMKAITPQAQSCYAKEEFSGMVTVKFSVNPEGTITKAAATGKHASSDTGACVVKAVRKATFPAFDGTVTSFSFPFLLSP